MIWIPIGSPKIEISSWNSGDLDFPTKTASLAYPKKKTPGPKTTNLPSYSWSGLDQQKKKLDTFIPEPLGSPLGRKADLKNHHQVGTLKKTHGSSGTWISSPGRFTASCNKWVGIGSCARISSSPAFRGRFRFLGGGRDSKKWEKGWKKLKRCSFLWNYKGLQRVGSSF